MVGDGVMEIDMGGDGVVVVTSGWLRERNRE